MKKYLPLLAAAVLTALPAAAQEEDGGVSLKGSIQSDVLIPQEDQKIGTGTYKDWGLTNTYVDLQLLNKYVSAGARFEYLDHPLPGFEKDFQGWGVPHIYVTGRLKHAELTLGDYYEQFGSGFILRTYEERSLGIDNSLRGARLTLKPVKGVTLKALAGQQRVYWHNRSWDKDFTYLNGTDPWIYGADLELNVDQWFKRMDENGSRLTLGVSAVTKHERAEDIVNLRPTGAKDEFGTDILGAYKLNLPTDVGAIDVRAQFQKGNYSLMAEYALKSQDPSFDNGYIYRRGNALMLSGSYSKRGMSLLLQAKRSEDMAFRSERSRTGTAAFINHLPAFSQQQTYALAALYPYATQNALGEWAFQGEFSYTFKRKTALGGKYGTTVKLNASHIRGIDRQPLTAAGQPVENLQGTKGYTTKFFRMGHDTYYQDINVQLDKKVTKDFKLNLMYMHQRYNKTIVEGHGGTINSHIAIAEGKYTLNKKLTLRGEAQYLHTKQDQGDWWYGLLELSVLPHFMFTVSDMYNAKVPNTDETATSKQHFYMVSGCYTHGAHRLQLSYGKTRAGYNCTGGVCRYVPASKGLQVSYNFNF
ncbi:MAG: DUF6029 family protein [Bacteroidales bacterium]|nr:DUF6029 family protein [Bacteroidales bacterium]MDY2705657.1 DUF6029 family protein [Alloprevotella sp.]